MEGEGSQRRLLWPQLHAQVSEPGELPLPLGAGEQRPGVADEAGCGKGWSPADQVGDSEVSSGPDLQTNRKAGCSF